MKHQKKFDVYRITCRTTGLSYVGKGNTHSRWLSHVRVANSGKGYHLHAAIRKYGVDDFIIETLTTFDNEADAYAYEARLIDDEDLLRNGLNCSRGMTVISDLEGARIKRRQTVMTSWSNERRETLAKRFKGCGNPFFNRTHTSSTKKRIRETLKASAVERGKKISVKLTGRKHTLATREKMSKTSPTKGRTWIEVYGLERANEMKERLVKSKHGTQVGEKHPCAKLTSANVIEIRLRSIDKSTDVALAAEFHVSQRTVEKIRKRISWRHLLS